MEKCKFSKIMFKCRHSISRKTFILTIFTINIRMMFYLIDIVQKRKMFYSAIFTYSQEKYIFSVAYILGFYNESNSFTLTQSVSTLIVVNLLLIIDQYIIKLQLYINKYLSIVNSKINKNLRINQIINLYKKEKELLLNNKKTSNFENNNKNHNIKSSEAAIINNNKLILSSCLSKLNFNSNNIEDDNIKKILPKYKNELNLIYNKYLKLNKYLHISKNNSFKTNVFNNNIYLLNSKSTKDLEYKNILIKEFEDRQSVIINMLNMFKLEAQKYININSCDYTICELYYKFILSINNLNKEYILRNINSCLNCNLLIKYRNYLYDIVFLFKLIFDSFIYGFILIISTKKLNLFSLLNFSVLIFNYFLTNKRRYYKILNILIYLTFIFVCEFIIIVITYSSKYDLNSPDLIVGYFIKNNLLPNILLNESFLINVPYTVYSLLGIDNVLLSFKEFKDYVIIYDTRCFINYDLYLIIACIIYLDLFKYSIFKSKYFNSINFRIFKCNENIAKSIEKLTDVEYNEIYNNMYKNYNIKIDNLKTIKYKILNYTNQKSTIKSKYLNALEDNNVLLSKKDTFNKATKNSKSSKRNSSINQSLKLQFSINNNANSYEYKTKLTDRQFSKTIKCKLDYSTDYTLNTNNIYDSKNYILASIIKFFQKFFYLTFHNYILLLIMLLAIIDNSLISVLYVLFSLYYFNLSKKLLLGQIYNINLGLKILYVVLLVDLFCQIILQFFFNEIYYFDDNLSNKTLYIIGLYKINKLILISNNLDYSYNGNYYNNKIINLLFYKSIISILITFLLSIYKTRLFREYYFNYLILKKKSDYKSAIMYTYYFNNLKIKEFEHVMKSRKEVDKILIDLEDQLKNWDNKLYYSYNSENNSNKTIFNNNISYKYSNVCRSIGYDKQLSLSTIKKCTSSNTNNNNTLINRSSLKYKNKIDPRIKNKVLKLDFAKTNNDIKNLKNDKSTKTMQYYINTFEHQISKYFEQNILIKFMFFIKDISFSYKLSNKKSIYKLDYNLLIGETANTINFEENLNDFASILINDLLALQIKFNRKYNKKLNIGINDSSNNRLSLLNLIDINDEINNILNTKLVIKKKKIRSLKNTQNTYLERKAESSKECNNKNIKLLNNKKNTSINNSNINEKKAVVLFDSESSSKNSINSNISLSFNKSKNKLNIENNIRKCSSLEQKKPNTNYDSVSINNLMQLSEAQIKYINSKKEKIYKKLSKHIFLSKNLRNYYIFKKSLKYLFFCIFENYNVVCYLFMLINHIIYANLISMIWVCALFGFALIENPRPTKRFWNNALIYGLLIVAFKFTLQLELTKIIIFGYKYKSYVIKNKYNSFNFSNSNSLFYEDIYKIGIKVYTYNSNEFYFYIIFDLLLILNIIILQFTIIFKGMWNIMETQIETIENAIDRVYSNKNNTDIINLKFKSHNEISEHIWSRAEKLKKYKQIKANIKDNKKLNLLKQYYNRTFPVLRVRLNINLIVFLRTKNLEKTITSIILLYCLV